MPDVDSPEVLQRYESELDLVESLAVQVLNLLGSACPVRQELIAYGRLGLWEAARRFDPERGVPFRAFAIYRVRGAIYDGIRANSRFSRRTYERLRAAQAAHELSEGMADDTFAAVAAGLTPAEADQRLADHLASMATAMAMVVAPQSNDAGWREVVAVANNASPEDCAETSELIRVVMSEVEKLPEREAHLVRRYFFHDETIEVIAEGMGLSRSWSCRLLARALGRLTKRLRVQEPSKP